MERSDSQYDLNLLLGGKYTKAYYLLYMPAVKQELDRRNISLSVSKKKGMNVSREV